jgi:SAM-dependent methyltransferase
MPNNASAEFHCWYATDRQSALSKGQWILASYRKFLRPGPVCDLGCGEGGLLLALREMGLYQISGVDSNPELCDLAASFGLPITRSDLGDYLRQTSLSPAVYFYLDVIEHVPFEFNLLVLNSLPVGSRLIVQTPFTKSLLGHQYYMNVPSHVSPYSPWVIQKMLSRCGYDVIADGSLEGAQTPNWKNRLRAFFIRKALGIDPELLLGGGNYFIVADKNREPGKEKHVPIR